MLYTTGLTGKTLNCLSLPMVKRLLHPIMGEKDDREGVYLHFLIVRTTTPQTSKFSMSLIRMAL